jgi:hypothetical protein
VNRLRALLALALLGVALPSDADTRYVTDRLAVAVRERPGRDARTLTLIPSDTAVEAIARRGAYTRVRLADGTEGWVEAIYLTASPTAALRLAQARAAVPVPVTPPPPPASGPGWGMTALAVLGGTLLGVAAGYLAHRARVRSRLYGLDL